MKTLFKNKIIQDNSANTLWHILNIRKLQGNFFGKKTTVKMFDLRSNASEYLASTCCKFYNNN